MTDSTDNAQGPERAALRSVKPDDWPETVHVGKAVVRLPNGVESGNWYSKPKDGDKTVPFTRADLAPDPQDARLAEAAQTIVTAMERAQIDMRILRMFFNGEPATALRALAAFDKGGKTDG